MHWSRSFPLCVMLSVALVSCQAPLQGPDVDVAAVLVPEPLPPAERAQPRPADPTVAAGRFRAWVVRQVSTDGDVAEGYWLDLSLAPPVIEVFEPAATIPRAPKTPLVKPGALVATPPSGADGLGVPKAPRQPAPRPPIPGGTP